MIASGFLFYNGAAGLPAPINMYNISNFSLCKTPFFVYNTQIFTSCSQSVHIFLLYYNQTKDRQTDNFFIIARVPQGTRALLIYRLSGRHSHLPSAAFSFLFDLDFLNLVIQIQHFVVECRHHVGAL